MQYTILTASNADELEKIVNQKIKTGWQPLGGCITVKQSSASSLNPRTPPTRDKFSRHILPYYFAQTMTLNEKKE